MVLVTDGLLACSCNSIYVAMNAALLDIGVVLGLIMLIAEVPVFAAIIRTRFIAIEKEMLVVTCGD